MRNPILWLIFALGFAVVGLFLLSAVRKYMVDAKNAQG